MSALILGGPRADRLIQRVLRPDVDPGDRWYSPIAHTLGRLRHRATVPDRGALSSLPFATREAASRAGSIGIPNANPLPGACGLVPSVSSKSGATQPPLITSLDLKGTYEQPG